MLPIETGRRGELGIGISVRYDRETASFGRKEAWSKVLTRLGAIAVPLEDGLVDLYPFRTVPFGGEKQMNVILKRYGFERVI